MHIKVDLKIFLFAIIFIITKIIKIYTLLMFFSVIHEVGHLICGLVLGFKPKVITIMPYGIKLNFKINYDDYNRKVRKGSLLSIKKILIALAGPMTNLIIALITIILKINKIETNFLGFNSEEIVYSNIIIGIFNLIPIYPMDGGKIIKELLHISLGLRKSYKYIQDISWISIAVLSAITSILILYSKNIAILITLLYLWILTCKSEREFSIKEQIYNNLEKMKKIE